MAPDLSLTRGTGAFIQASATALPLADESVAACVTSPPYNVGIAYDAHDDRMAWPDYVALANGACREIARVLVPSGRIWLNVTPVVPGDGGRISLLHIWSSALLEAGLCVRDYVAWTTAGRGGTTAWGSWQSPSGPNLRGEWETMIVAYKGAWKRSTPPEFKGWRDDLGEWTSLVSNVWRVAPERRRVGGHPVPFPVALPRRAIRLSTWPGETVLDPFCGQGATVRAAVELGRNGIGTDISSLYCDMARTSLAAMVPADLAEIRLAIPATHCEAGLAKP